MFQSTRPRGARLVIHYLSNNAISSFNPRARVGRDQSKRRSTSTNLSFQSTRPRGARLRGASRRSHVFEFQSTRPRGARRGLKRISSAFASFNPRARVGRDHSRRVGASCRHGRFNPRARVGRDSWRSYDPIYHTCFNPRARVGRDIDRASISSERSAVSIRAPAWGATTSRVARATPCFGFNPRARVGRDMVACFVDYARPTFQSTRPRGARPTPIIVIHFRNYVSIHAPAWGATRRLPLRIVYTCLFQSTRPRGARPTGEAMSRYTTLVSIHAPAWGATPNAEFP